MNSPEPETTPCETCNTPTEMLGTKRCTNCWEVEHRLEIYLRSRRAVQNIMDSPAFSAHFWFIDFGWTEEEGASLSSETSYESHNGPRYLQARKEIAERRTSGGPIYKEEWDA